MMFLVALLRETCSKPLSMALFLWVDLLLRSPMPRFLPFLLEDRLPPTEKEKQTSHQIFFFFSTCKNRNILNFLNRTGNKLGAGVAVLFLERTHLLAFLSNPGLSFLTLQSLGHHPREEVGGGTGRARLSLEKITARLCLSSIQGILIAMDGPMKQGHLA